MEEFIFLKKISGAASHACEGWGEGPSSRGGRRVNPYDGMACDRGGTGTVGTVTPNESHTRPGDRLPR